MSGMFGNVPQIQVPDFGATLARAQGMQANRLAMLAQQRQMDEAQQRQDFFAQHGAGFASPDAAKRMNLLAMLTQQPGGAQMGLPMLEQERRRAELRAIMSDGTEAAPVMQPGGQPAPGGAAIPPGDMNLPRGIRNNNPLNLSYVPGQPGVQGSDGRFGRYATPEEGIAASVRQLQMYGQRGLTTPAQIIGRWAPPSENNTGAYVAAVARRAGLDPNQPIDMSDAATLSRLVGAMAHHENGRPIDAAVVQRGVQMALAPRSGSTVPAASDNAIPAQAGGAPPNDASPARDNNDARIATLIRRAERLAAAGYQQEAQTTLALVQSLRRGEAARPVEIADPTSPTGRRLVSPQEATGAAAPAPDRNAQYVDLGDDAPQGAGRYERQADGSLRRVAAIPAREPTAVDPFGRANTLRDEFTRLTGDFRVVQTAFQNIQGAAASQTGAGDMSMLYSFVKLLDPASVVRESEFASAAASGSFGERVQGAAQRILSGERLPDSLRNSFLTEARTLYNTQRRAFDRTATTYRDLATRNGLDPANVVLPFDDADGAAAPSPPAAPGSLPQAAPGPGGRGTAEPPPGLPPGSVIRRIDPRTGRIQ